MFRACVIESEDEEESKNDQTEECQRQNIVDSDSESERPQSKTDFALGDLSLDPEKSASDDEDESKNDQKAECQRPNVVDSDSESERPQSKTDFALGDLSLDPEKSASDDEDEGCRGNIIIGDSSEDEDNSEALEPEKQKNTYSVEDYDRIEVVETETITAPTEVVASDLQSLFNKRKNDLDYLASTKFSSFKLSNPKLKTRDTYQDICNILSNKYKIIEASKEGQKNYQEKVIHGYRHLRNTGFPLETINESIDTALQQARSQPRISSFFGGMRNLLKGSSKQSTPGIKRPLQCSFLYSNLRLFSGTSPGPSPGLSSTSTTSAMAGGVSTSGIRRPLQCAFLC